MADNWELISNKDQQAALQQVQQELSLPASFINDMSINPNAAHKLGMSSWEFLQKDINGLPVLLDMHNYKLTSFAELEKIRSNYAVSIPVSCLPKEVEDILSSIKFSGIGEYRDCWEFIKHHITRVICSATLEYKGDNCDAFGEDGENDSQEIQEVSGLSSTELGDLLYPGQNQRVVFINSEELTGSNIKDLVSKIYFAAVLFHETAHQQVTNFRARGYKINSIENERYARLMGLYIFLKAYRSTAYHPAQIKRIKEHLQDYVFFELRDISQRNKDLKRFYESSSDRSFDEYDFDLVIFEKSGEVLYHDFRFNFKREFLMDYIGE